MKCVVFFLEEPSAKDLLQGLLPKLLSRDVDVRYLVFKGKQDLERNLVHKLRSWLTPDSVFVVLRDQDASECGDVKRGLQALVRESGRKDVLVRVACRELESWVLGDWNAVAKAFGQPELAALGRKAIYRDPDHLVRPVGELRKVLKDYQKRDGARRVGVLLDPNRNQSTSFRAFCSGVQRLIA